MTDVVRTFLGLPVGKKVIVFTVLFFLLLGVGLLFESDFIQGLVRDYGLIGLFFVAFIGSTVFIFFPVELVFPLLLPSGIGSLSVVLVATLGALLGTCVNYFLGFIGSSIIEQRVDGEKLEHAKKLMDKYGWLGLFVVIALPLPVDPITVLPGIARMRFVEFTLTVAVAKLFKYAFYAGIFGALNGFL